MCPSNILYIDKSFIDGSGLYSKINLRKGNCVGLLARIYGNSEFDDLPFGRFINHSNESNLDLKLTIDNTNKIIFVLGIAKKDIKKGTELTADYNSKYAPKPNFLNTNTFNFDSYFYD